MGFTPIKAADFSAAPNPQAVQDDAQKYGMNELAQRIQQQQYQDSVNKSLWNNYMQPYNASAAIAKDFEASQPIDMNRLNALTGTSGTSALSDVFNKSKSLIDANQQTINSHVPIPKGKTFEEFLAQNPDMKLSAKETLDMYNHFKQGMVPQQGKGQLRPGMKAGPVVPMPQAPAQPQDRSPQGYFNQPGQGGLDSMGPQAPITLDQLAQQTGNPPVDGQTPQDARAPAQENMGFGENPSYISGADLLSQVTHTNPKAYMSDQESKLIGEKLGLQSAQLIKAAQIAGKSADISTNDAEKSLYYRAKLEEVANTTTDNNIRALALAQIQSINKILGAAVNSEKTTGNGGKGSGKTPKDPDVEHDKHLMDQFETKFTSQAAGPNSDELKYNKTLRDQAAGVYKSLKTQAAKDDFWNTHGDMYLIRAGLQPPMAQQKSAPPPANSPAPQIKVDKNGVKWKRGPNGEAIRVN